MKTMLIANGSDFGVALVVLALVYITAQIAHSHPVVLLTIALSGFFGSGIWLLDHLVRRKSHG